MSDPTNSSSAVDPRFGGIARLYGDDAATRLRESHVMVIGLGGVGSWTVEALARSGVGRLTLVDLDEVCTSNINRQIHATDETVGRSKCDVMRQRIAAINPDAVIDVRELFFTEKTADTLLGERCDFVVDAIDSFKHKVLLIDECDRREQPIVVCGSAGGRRNASEVTVDDLARTYRDALLQMVRKRLRQNHGFPKRGTKKFHIPAVFSPEPPVYPVEGGAVCDVKPEMEEGQSRRLSCEQGLGAATFVTGTMGFMAAGIVVNHVAQTSA